MRNAVAVIAVGVLIAEPVALRAQQTAVWARRVDSLSLQLQRSADAVRLYEDSLKKVDGELTSIAAGPFRLLVTPATESLARAAAASVDRELRPVLGRSLNRLGKYRIGIRPVSRVELLGPGSHPESNVVIVSDWMPRPGVVPKDDPSSHPFSSDSSAWFYGGQSTHPADVEALAAELRSRALERLSAEYDPQFRAWLVYSRPPSAKVTELEWSKERAGLLTSNEVIARRCYRGVRADCEVLLGFRAVPDPVMDWFDADGRRAQVERSIQSGNPFDKTMTRDCIDGRQDGSCVRVLRNVDVNVLLNASYWRLGLLQEAMKLGGPDAFERLIATRGTPSEKLAAAAGVSSDSLVSAWMNSVRSAPSPSDTMTPLIAGGSLLWIVVLAGLGARSSRWR